MVGMHAAMALAALSGLGQTVLLDFYADWCGPCRMMDPVVKQMAAQGYPVRQINIDHDRALASQFHVSSIPCFVMVVNSREVDREVGATSPQRLAQMCHLGAAAPGARPPAMIATAPPSGGTLPPHEFGQYCPVRPAGAPPATESTAPPPANVAWKGDADLLSVTARLRIEDAGGWSCGSGTLIDCRSGSALILTCGHIFRDSKGKGRIEVDLFGVNAAEHVPGYLVSYDLDRDVGLVGISVSRPLVVAPVAAAGSQLRPGDAIATVGCNNGDNPTVRRARVTMINRYAGPPNVEVADLPVLGRSGGGLFTPDGIVVGVCNAADPEGHEGLYASLTSIYEEFAHGAVTQLFREPSPTMRAVVAETQAAAGEAPLAARTPMRPVPTPTAERVRLTAEERELIEEVQRREAEGADVIFVVRPRNAASGTSEIYSLKHASPQLLKALAPEGQPAGSQPPPTAEAPLTATDPAASAGQLLR